MKFDRGVLAVGCGALSDKDCWMVRNSLPSRQDLKFDMCPRAVLTYDKLTGTVNTLGTS